MVRIRVFLPWKTSRLCAHRLVEIVGDLTICRPVMYAKTIRRLVGYLYIGQIHGDRSFRRVKIHDSVDQRPHPACRIPMANVEDWQARLNVGVRVVTVREAKNQAGNC